MADISVIKLGSSNQYNIKDASARNMIAAPFSTASAYNAGDFVVNDGKLYKITANAAAGTTWANIQKAEVTVGIELKDLRNAISGGIHYIGVTTTEITDGGHQDPITIEGAQVSPNTGDLVISGTKEYIATVVTSPSRQVTWHEFGSTGSLKALAFKDTATGTFTPLGHVGSTFTGTKANLTANYTPSGTISDQTFTGDQTNLSLTYTPEGTVSVTTAEPTGSEISNYTPAGIINQQTLTTSVSSSGKYTPSGSVSQPGFTGTAATISVSGTTSGTVTGTSVTVTLEDKSVNSVTGAGTLPTLTTSVANEILTIDFDPGALTTYSAISVASPNTPTVNVIDPTFTGAAITSTGSYTPGGTVSKPTFTGTEGDLSVNGSITAAPITQASFTGTGTKISATFTGKQSTATGVYTPEGSVSKATFTGTNATITTNDYTPEGSVTSTFTGEDTSVTVA